MKNKLPLIAWAALPLTIGLAFAQTQRVQPIQPGQAQQSQNQGTNQFAPGMPDQPGMPMPNQSGMPGQQGMPQRQPLTQSGTNYSDVFLQKLAAQLGLTVDKLKAAAVAAGSATIDQGVKAGDFPSDRAAEMKQNLNDNPFAFGGHGPGGHGMHGRGGHGGMDGGMRGMDRDGDGDYGQGQSDTQNGTQNDNSAQGTAQNGNFTF